jgi:hypothetical protein
MQREKINDGRDNIILFISSSSSVVGVSLSEITLRGSYSEITLRGSYDSILSHRWGHIMMLSPLVYKRGTVTHTHTGVMMLLSMGKDLLPFLGSHKMTPHE